MIDRTGKYEGKEFKEIKKEKKKSEELNSIFSPKSPEDDLFQIKLRMMELESFSKELEEKLKEKDFQILNLKKEIDELKKNK